MTRRKILFTIGGIVSGLLLGAGILFGLHLWNASNDIASYVPAGTTLAVLHNTDDHPLLTHWFPNLDTHVGTKDSVALLSGHVVMTKENAVAQDLTVDSLRSSQIFRILRPVTFNADAWMYINPAIDTSFSYPLKKSITLPPLVIRFGSGSTHIGIASQLPAGTPSPVTLAFEEPSLLFTAADMGALWEHASSGLTPATREQLASTLAGHAREWFGSDISFIYDIAPLLASVRTIQAATMQGTTQWIMEGSVPFSKQDSLVRMGAALSTSRPLERVRQALNDTWTYDTVRLAEQRSDTGATKGWNVRVQPKTGVAFAWADTAFLISSTEDMLHARLSGSGDTLLPPRLAVAAGMVTPESLSILKEFFPSVAWDSLPLTKPAQWSLERRGKLSILHWLTR